MSPYRSRVVNLFVAVLLAATSPSAFGQIDFVRDPIRYDDAEVNDPVARLQKRINAGEATLTYDEESGGYLKSLLDALEVPIESQTLVFSKTSFQQRLITPRAPRALYFNDQVYVGFVQRGDVLELSAVDDEQGAIFYTLAQQEKEKPRFVRDRGNCLTCHASSRTHDVPGLTIRSVYPSLSGMPHYGAGTFRTNHDSPLNQRWGGWYVTGTHGQQRHMGNVCAHDSDRPENLDTEAGANVTVLGKLVNTDPYLSPHSDIVALMVLEHQTEMHNLITYANFATRTALYQAQSMNKVLERPEGYVSESIQRRIDSAASKLVAYMLFCDEAELTGPIRGTSGFAEHFAARGPFDEQGRSLRQFDLAKRIFKYPCSYLIYSDAFEALPLQVQQSVYRQLWEVLTRRNTEDKFQRLTPDDRLAILEILRATKKGLPVYWSEASSP